MSSRFWQAELQTMLSLRHCMESCCFGATRSPSHDECNENFITHLFSLSHRAICFFQSITEDMHIDYVIACCCATPRQCYCRPGSSPSHRCHSEIRSAGTGSSQPLIILALVVKGIMYPSGSFWLARMR